MSANKARLQMQRKGTVGHGPGLKTTKFPPIAEIPLPPTLIQAQIAGALESYTKAYRMGDVTVLVSKEGGQGWHMSTAHPTRYPTWDEIAHLRYMLLPDNMTMAMLLPPQSAYINIHENCFQLHEVEGERLK